MIRFGTTLAALEDSDLLEHYVDLEAAIDVWVEERDRIQQELERRMQERGASELPHPSIECVLKYPTPDIDYGKLARVRELVPPEVLAEGWTPEHQETVTVAERYNMVKVNTWKRFGADVAAVIEAAKIPGRARLIVKRKKEAKPNGT